MDPEASNQAGRIVALLPNVLGEALLGVYLDGSAVIGGLKPTSDLDVFGAIRTAGDNEPSPETQRV
jgi:streptomycin 3"-adenylyltransferase